MHTVTIGIPFYNSEKYLEKAILSVINQSYTNWKLILLDDGSTDSSLDIAKSFSFDKRVQVISDGLNKNLACRLNELIDLSDTKYIARMDADDIMHFDRIRIQVELMEYNPSIDVLGTNAYVIDNEGTIKGVRTINNNELVDTKTFIHPSVIAKTVWYKNNKYDEGLNRGQDFELWYRAISFSNFKSTNLPLLYYREFGIKYYPKYYNLMKTYVYLFKRDCPSSISFSWLYGIIYCLIAYIIYRTYYMLGKENVLLRKRSIELDSSFKLIAVKDLNKSTIHYNHD